MNIVVLAGGLSTERDVSLSTGSKVCKALREIGHRALLLDVYLGIPFSDGADPAALFSGDEKSAEILKIPDTAPDLALIKQQRSDGGKSFFGPNVLTLCKSADLVFIALHGICGEDGKLQAAFDLMGIPYTGSGSLGSALAMNKDMTKKLLSAAGIPTARWISADRDTDLDAAAAEIGLPCVVKPCNGGSSIGVFIPRSLAELKQSVSEALKNDSLVIIEEYISGREFSVGILNGKALPVIEIVPHTGFYDFQNKYQSGRTDEICPARLDEQQTLQIQSFALKTHNILLLGSYSRVDFMLDAGGRFICLEANTLPGMTPTSLIPQEAMADGVTYNELCSRIVEAAM